MVKVKYRFDPESLTFEKYKKSKVSWVFMIFGGICLLVILIWLFDISLSGYFETPKEKQLRREIDNFELNYQLLNNKLEHLNKVISDLEHRDENIYRTIFEADPIPKSIRDAGYGGIEKYRDLEGYEYSNIIIKTTKKLDRFSKKLYVLSKSYDEIVTLASKKQEMLASRPAIQPIANEDLTRIASGFGWRVHPIYRVPKLHEGIDFTAPRGTDVYATGDGTVILAKYTTGGYGREIIVDHGFGYKTIYAHLYRIKVKKGQKVKRGELVGTVGSTGLSTSPHLHYEVRYKNSPINPVHYFYNDLTAEEYAQVLTLAKHANQALD